MWWQKSHFWGNNAVRRESGIWSAFSHPVGRNVGILLHASVFMEEEYFERVDTHISEQKQHTAAVCVCVCLLIFLKKFLFTLSWGAVSVCECVETLFFTHVFQALVLSWSRRCVCVSVFTGSWECRAQLVVMVQEWTRTSKWGRIIDFCLYVKQIIITVD